jgi:choline-phosphate cytidylyltransferase
MGSYDESNKNGPLTSPSALSHLSRRLEIPRADSPGPGSDFATGYSLGLIGGVRSWVSCFIFLGIRIHANVILR